MACVTAALTAGTVSLALGEVPKSVGAAVPGQAKVAVTWTVTALHNSPLGSTAIHAAEALERVALSAGHGDMLPQDDTTRTPDICACAEPPAMRAAKETAA